MKKIVITLLLSIFLLNNTWADTNTCSIQDAPAKVLNDYVSTLRKVVSIVTKNINTKVPDDSTLTKIWKDFTKWMNKIINFNWFYSSFEFTTLWITNEVPYQVKRDRMMLKNELIYLQNYLERIIRRWFAENEVSDICSWIDNCNLSWNWQQILTELIKNTSNIIAFYENSILWDTSDIETNFILVPANFKDEMSKYYNKNTLTDCSKSEWWFWDRIEKSFSEISLDTMYMKWATQKWIDAWALLTWVKSNEKQRDLERTLLKNELSRQWVPSDQAWIVMNNLENFNQNWWYSFWNNFISNSFSTISDAGWKFISSFWSLTTWLYDISKTLGSAIVWWKTSEWQVATNFINEETLKKDDTQIMFIKMQDLYNEQLIYAGQVTTMDEKIVWDLVDLHLNLSDITNWLNKTIPNAENACIDQCINKWWNCSDYTF